ncbi:hypothetical protein NPIL_437221 [Nephila pilipes]|uniref:Uncharacterized protein n=1 Tax=Nephila pilipes TaxID=299642 RepID=A0A8X6UC60_NEPPI|nr:hypothetical protein NPIL_437221 [Nephila pilipes]
MTEIFRYAPVFKIAFLGAPSPQIRFNELFSYNDPIPLQEHVREFNCGRLFYRTFFLDIRRDILYVGAMDKVFRLNLANINRTRCERKKLLMASFSLAEIRPMSYVEADKEGNGFRIDSIRPLGRPR